MKGAVILSKDFDFFHAFVGSVYKAGLPCILAENSIKIIFDNGAYILVYDRTDAGDIFNEFDIPPEAKFSGYNYAFLVECRSEEVFCNVFGDTSLRLDMLICDGNGVLYRPNELSPETIVL